MRLFYISNARIPTEKAHGIQIMKMCEAFSQNSTEVILVHPYRVQTKEMKAVTNIWDYYGVEEKFKIICLPSIDLAVLLRILPKSFERPWFLIQSLSFAVVAFLWLLFQKLNYNDIIYSRDLFSLVLILAFKRFIRARIFYEAHVLPQSKKNLAIFIFSRLDGLITNTSKLKEFYIRSGVSVEKVFMALNGVDLEKFNVKQTQNERRKELNLPQDKKIIGYSGQLRTTGMEKGIGDLIEAYKVLRANRQDLIVVIVGGNENDIRDYKLFARKQGINEGEILFLGHKEYKRIPFYLAAFDILTMPFPYNEHYAFYMSPLKLFEYMASKRPMVATDLPSIKEILHDDENAILVEPNNPKALADGIMRLLEDIELAHRISEQAYRDVQQYTWRERAKNIIKFISRQKRN